MDRVTLGFEKKGRLISPEEKERVAYHELGHTLMALSLPNADPVRRVSIIPRSIGALGHTLQLPDKERYLLTEPELETRIAVLLGGRGAEDVVYNGVVSTGASDDLERASEMARQMVTRYGMSKSLGNLTYGIPHQSRFSENAVRLGREKLQRAHFRADRCQVRGIVDRSLRAGEVDILTERRGDLELIASSLMKKETLEREELEKLLGIAPGRNQRCSGNLACKMPMQS